MSPIWQNLSSPGVAAAIEGGAVAVLPVGATEQHGSHLATGADSLFAERVSLAASESTGDLVLPTIAYGCSLGHTHRWPGTLSLGTQTLAAVVADVGRWAFGSGVRKLVMVNGHATNAPPCESALLELRHELPDLRLRFVSLFDLSPEIRRRYSEDAPDFHANEAETSLMLHLDPARVDMSLAADEPDRTKGRVFQYPMPTVSDSGVVGAPSNAAAVRGEELFGELVVALAELLTAARFEADPDF